MGKCAVYATESFQRLYSSLTKDEQEWIRRMKEQLEEQPSGKPLHCDWFREKKKYIDKRLYFLVDEEKGKILFMSFAPKKEQQKIVDFIVSNKEELLAHLRSL